MSPEMLLKKDYNEKTDIWSLGIVLFMLLCNRFPFAGLTMETKRDSIINGTPHYEYINNTRSQELILLLKRMLDKESATRISIEDIRKQLCHFPVVPKDKLLRFKIYSSSFKIMSTKKV